MTKGAKLFIYSSLGVVVAVGIGLALWFFWPEADDDSEQSDRGRDGAPQVATQSVSCEGKLFDSHMHLDNDGIAQEYSALMDANGVGCGVLFVQMDLDNQLADLLLAREELSETEGRFIPFFDVVETGATVLTPERLAALESAYGGKYKGYGEFGLYRPELQGTDLTQAPWPTLFAFAGEHSLVPMIHLELGEASQAGLEAMLARYPDTKVLIHGFERGGAGFAALLKKYPNLYFTLDTATLLKEGTGPGLHLMYPNGGGNAETFARDFAANKAGLLQQAQDEWTQVIEAAPDRVLWGTDVSFDWHAEPEVYSKLISFSNEFIATLPTKLQDKYRYQNAVRLFGKQGTVHEPLSEAEFDQLDELESDEPDED